MGSVTATITTLLLLIVFFNRPYKDGVGGLRARAPWSGASTSSTRTLADLGITWNRPVTTQGVATTDA